MRLILCAAILTLAATCISGQAAAVKADDVAFMTQQCGIDQSDVNVIPKLHKKKRAELLSLVARRDCALLKSFKDTRLYYRQLTPNLRPMPMLPALWDVDYLTDAEFLHYKDIVENASW